MKFKLGLFALLLAGCASQPATVEVPQTVVVQQTVEIPVTVEITKEVEVTRLATVIVEVTSTPMPTPTLVPTTIATVGAKPKSYLSYQVVDAFKAAGLEAENPRAMTVEDYGLAPLVAIEGVRFFIPTLGTNVGGRVMSFSSGSDQTLIRDFYVDLGKQSAAFFSWVFVRGNILVQINGTLPEDNARQYEAALNALFE